MQNACCISESISCFLQTNDTSPMDDSLIADVGYLAETNAKYNILDGT
jgi:hypothetical protein